MLRGRSGYVRASSACGCIAAHGGLGHQVCTDAVISMQRVSSKQDFNWLTVSWPYAPCESPEGTPVPRANELWRPNAWANRRSDTIRGACVALSGHGRRNPRCGFAARLTTICHNIAKRETHIYKGKPHSALCPPRKGAAQGAIWVRACPGTLKLIASIGQPVLVPGSMDRVVHLRWHSGRRWKNSLAAPCHGAGRQMSRSQARKNVHGASLRDQLNTNDILIETGSLAGLAEEAPQAYKDVSAVVETVHQAGLAHKVARTRPLAVIKG